MTFEDIALHVPTVLLPGPDIDMTKWSVIACDQYTSQVRYWEEVETIVGRSPSTLKLIFPEIYLGSPDRDAMLSSINASMREYLSRGVLVPQGPGFILVDRQTSRAASRKGLVAALDLEHYDYRAGSRSLIRPTEGTILERLPPRITIREGASLELPHIMVLIDDPDHTVIEPLFANPLHQIYDVDLMLGGGRVKGYLLDDAGSIRQTAAGLSRLADPEQFRRRYGASRSNVLLYAMGDGNHSFATAKAVWERTKEQATDRRAVMEHPARYALVEIVNIHDPGLEFEPIHRAVFNVDASDLLQQARSALGKLGSACSFEQFSSREDLHRRRRTPRRDDSHTIFFIHQNGCGEITVSSPRLTLAVATLQTFIDSYLLARPHAKIDYIHGTEAVTRLGSGDDTVGFYLPALDKGDLFKTIIRDGALPLKTFSMGEADEKRYYIECRKITP